MALYSILSVGSHPNVAFYNWRLQASKTAKLTSIASTAIPDSSIPNSFSNPTSVTYNWTSDQFGNSTYNLDTVFANIDDYISLNSTNNDPLDFIILSATSLQELSTVCSSLNLIIKNQLANHSVPTILVESTNFVNLEPFIKMSLQINEEIPILSIMSDFDIREIGHNNYLVYKSKKESELLYVGKSGRENKYTSEEIGLINKIADLFENSNIDVYKLNTPLEFLSYQWKFALPKITVEPLSIIFEKPFPYDLQQQILAKPLISGLIFEIITVIKTMGCKLFNSYDNEDSLLERLTQLYPSVDLSPDASEAPKLYYDFFNQNKLYLDLLLLQPILIADDYQVKTPYLEFLYAVMSQYNSNNLSTLNNSSSIFWLRKNSENIRQLKLNQDEIATQNAIKEKELQKAQIALQAVTPPRSGYDKPSQPAHTQYQIKRSSTDPQIDPEMEELSDMANSYGMVNKTPPGVNSREYHQQQANAAKPSNGGLNHSTSISNMTNLQPAFPVDNRMPGNSSPNFVPQQNLPHGLPSQGLPPNQQIFGSPQQYQQQQQQQQYPIQHQQQQSRRSFYPNQPPPQNRLSNKYQNGGGFHPNGNGYNSNGNGTFQNGNYPPPVNQYNSRDDISYMSGRTNNGFMNNNGSIQNFDASFNSMNSGNIGNRQFKPTSRKSSRKSTAVLTNSLVGNDPVNISRGGMPTRHSMAPQPSNPNLRNNVMNNGMNPGMNPGMNNSTFKKPQGLQQSASQIGLDNSFLQPNMNGVGNGSSEGLTNNSTGSLPPAMSSTTNLVSVPEATPAPTPAYIPTPEKTEKKKKRGFLGLGKKKDKD